MADYYKHAAITIAARPKTCDSGYLQPGQVCQKHNGSNTGTTQYTSSGMPPCTSTRTAPSPSPKTSSPLSPAWPANSAPSHRHIPRGALAGRLPPRAKLFDLIARGRAPQPSSEAWEPPEGHAFLQLLAEPRLLPGGGWFTGSGSSWALWRTGNGKRLAVSLGW